MPKAGTWNWRRRSELPANQSQARLVAGRWRRWLRGTAALLAGVVLGWLLYSHALAPMRVAGDSMAPYLDDGDAVLLVRPGLDKLFGGSGGERPGDVVVLAAPGDGATLVKRVIAGGGATVEIAEGVVSVDGSPVTWGDPELSGAASAVARSVPSGSLYVLGDNRLPLASRDSRSFGPVATAALKGRVVLVIRLPW